MASQGPRIYTYKITFEEVPYYYYGVHKEKRFNEEYWGSPYTHKWCWEFYTPKKQILELFEYSDEGWMMAQEIEKQLIRPFYNTDKWCLNRNCGGKISLEILRENGKNIGNKSYEMKIGVHSLTKEEKINFGRKGGQKSYEEQKGIFSLTQEEKIEVGRKVGQKNVEEKRGIFSLSFEEKSEHSKKLGEKLYEERKGIHARTKKEMQEHGRKNGLKSYEEGKGIFSLTSEERSKYSKMGGQKLYDERKGIFSLTKEERSENSRKTASKRWKCTITGFVSNACGLSRYQKKRNIDTSNRVCIS